MKAAISLIGAGALVLSLGTAAQTGHDDEPYQRVYRGDPGGVVETLYAHGFVSWRDIELDDGKWEVDDARHVNGGVYDLDIRRGRIVKWERD